MGDFCQCKMGSIGVSIHLLQAALSAYSLFHAYNAITKLRSWEPATKQAAKVSDAARKELSQTRTTQATGALALLGSFAAAIYLIARSPEDSTTRLGFNLAIATICVLARTQISKYMKDHGKVPMAQQYNDALNSTVEIRGYLGILSLAWFGSAVLEAQMASNHLTRGRSSSAQSA